MKLVVLGLSITSSWGNGHATTYRGLLRELSRAGHSVLLVEGVVRPAIQAIASDMGAGVG